MATPLDDGSWEIRGHRVTFPVRIRDAGAACATYVVRADRARTLLSGTGLEPVSVAGRTLLFLALIDYRVNDLGVYREVATALPVRHRGRRGLHILQLPVTEEFTMQAGRALWGLPKWLARADLTVSGRHGTCRLDARTPDGPAEPVLTAAVSTLPVRFPFPVRAAVTAFAPRDGDVLASPVRARVRGVRIGARASLRLTGPHPMAAQLRALGLPRRPLLTTTIDHVAFDMDPAGS
ncbi:MAG: acetoacetate decarboxylase family protein [Pseudonocardia sp.]|nr:acetoacetate decarboxylase family protein [Pseudonocardia sp.]